MLTTPSTPQRPDLHAPIIDFKVLRPELITPGYVFIAPYRNLDPGPYIYDNYGELVWSGAGSSGPKTAHNPHVCQYAGRDHLCYFQGEQHQGFARGHGVIMDRQYRIVKTVESSGAGASSDMHEFRIAPYSDGKRALMTVYQPRQYDLTTNPRFNTERGMGWIVEGVFQEVDIASGEVVFEWRSLDHVDPGESWTMPGTTDTSGDGLHELSPWDYFHLNSIDKNEEGDYLLSARHVSAIYKVSGKDGSIVWQLGGANPSFEQENFVFSYQHDAKWISENETHTVFSFYDNASNTFNNTNKFSHGWIISIDHQAKKATMIKEWGAPESEGGLLSGSQGSLQLLPGGGCHIGWGEHSYFSEHTEDGEATMYGVLATRPSNVMIYRSTKWNWTAQPLTKPALWTYSRTGKGKMVFYVSWNGATEVKAWKFLTGKSSSGPWKLAQKKDKKGFETVLHMDEYHEWAYAQALDANGDVLEESVIARTFVPSKGLQQYCGDDDCQSGHRVNDEDYTDLLDAVDVDQQTLSTNRGFDTSHYYMNDTQKVALPETEEENLIQSSASRVANTPAATATITVTTSFSAPTAASDSSSSTTTDQTTPSSSSSGSSGSYVTSSLFILLVGVVAGFLLALFSTFLYRHGALRRFEPVVEKLSAGAAKRAWGSNGGTGTGGRGRYAAVGQENEMEGMESGSRGRRGEGEGY